MDSRSCVRYGAGVVAAIAGLWAVVGVALMLVYRVIGRHIRILERERVGLQQAFDRARLDSLRDGLTGLGNHRAFQEELDDQVLEAKEQNSSLALLMIDVDDLKKTNDRRGHAAGDEMLRSISQIIRANLRRTDRGYRIGGDEFALLLPGCSAADAEVIGRHILAGALSGHHGTGRRVLGHDRHLRAAGSEHGPQPAHPPCRRRAVLRQTPRPDGRQGLRSEQSRHGR